MRPIQRFVIFLGVLALILSALILPWTKQSVAFLHDIDGNLTQAHTTSGEYHLVYHPPEAYARYDDHNRLAYVADYTLDRDRLLLEWGLIILVTAGLVLVAKRKRE